jgi:uncharacterized membrane protein SpoIIM required for sporulation
MAPAPPPLRPRTTHLVASLLVAAGAAAGLALSAPPHFPQPTPEAAALHGWPALSLIAGRNLRVGLQLLVGAVTLGAYGVAQLCGLGFALGALLRACAGAGLSPTRVALLLAPHTLIEFAGFVALGALEFEAAVAVCRTLRDDRARVGCAQLRACGRRALIGFALILVAAVIEVWVTGAIAKSLFSAKG